MPYPVRLLSDKIDRFAENFSMFHQWCRLGYLKRPTGKGFISELFPNHFPSTGMETREWVSLMTTKLAFPNHFPSTGMETFREFSPGTSRPILSKPLPLNGDGNRGYASLWCHQSLSKPLPLNGDGNELYIKFNRNHVVPFPNHFPSTGMETRSPTSQSWMV